jgi:hypothetical protein
MCIMNASGLVLVLSLRARGPPSTGLYRTRLIWLYYIGYYIGLLRVYAFRNSLWSHHVQTTGTLLSFITVKRVIKNIRSFGLFMIHSVLSLHFLSEDRYCDSSIQHV